MVMQISRPYEWKNISGSHAEQDEYKDEYHHGYVAARASSPGAEDNPRESNHLKGQQRPSCAHDALPILNHGPWKIMPGVADPALHEHIANPAQG